MDRIMEKSERERYWMEKIERERYWDTDTDTDTDTETETETDTDTDPEARKKAREKARERSKNENIFHLWLPSDADFGSESFVITPELVMPTTLMRRPAKLLPVSVAVWKAWEPPEMDRFMELWRFVCHMKVSELEINYVKKKELKTLRETGERVLQVDLEDTELMRFYRTYIKFRECWKRKYYNCGEFEDITKIRCMYYSEGKLPRFVLQCPQPITLQVFSARIRQRQDRPLEVYGLIDIRDFVDANRIVIFNRDRDECQIVTNQDPYLHLTGPTRSPVINENKKMDPVSIEAELKVKGPVESEDKYIILQGTCRSYQTTDTVELYGPHMKLEILTGEIWKSVEATIFIRVIDGTWPTGFHGQFSAFTSHLEWKKVILLEFNGDGKMEQSRYVMSVNASGTLGVTFKAWNGELVIKENLSFDAVSRGRSIAEVKLGPCTMEVLVAWSLVNPYCEELVPSEWQSLCNF